MAKFEFVDELPKRKRKARLPVLDREEEPVVQAQLQAETAAAPPPAAPVPAAPPAAAAPAVPDVILLASASTEVPTGSKITSTCVR